MGFFLNCAGCTLFTDNNNKFGFLKLIDVSVCVYPDLAIHLQSLHSTLLPVDSLCI